MTAPRYDEQEFRQAFADRLAACLHNAGLTMEQAAQQLEDDIGRKLPHWNLRRLDDDPVWNEVMIVLCDILEVSPSWLGFGETGGETGWLVFGEEAAWDWRMSFDVPWDEVVERAKARAREENI